MKPSKFMMFKLEEKDVIILRSALGCLAGMYEIDKVSRKKFKQDGFTIKDIERLNSALEEFDNINVKV